MQVYTLARCNVVRVISIFVAPLIFPKGSSSFVKRSIRLSAVFADLRWIHQLINIKKNWLKSGLVLIRFSLPTIYIKKKTSNKIELPFPQQCLCRPKSIEKRIFPSPRHNTVLTPNFFHKPFCKKKIPRSR